MTTSRGAKSLYNICKGLPTKNCFLINLHMRSRTACCYRICKMGGEKKKEDGMHTEKVFYQSIHADAKLTLASLCLGSFFLAKSRESYTMAKPVVLPPPNWVLKPNTNTTSGVVLYILASFSLISVLGTVALPGCRTSTTYREDGECMTENSAHDGTKTMNIAEEFRTLTICFLWSSRFVMNLRVLTVTVSFWRWIEGETNYNTIFQQLINLHTLTTDLKH